MRCTPDSKGKAECFFSMKSPVIDAGEVHWPGTVIGQHDHFMYMFPLTVLTRIRLVAKRPARQWRGDAGPRKRTAVGPVDRYW